MNTQLVNSLVQIIQSLNDEERQLLEQRLDRQKPWQAIQRDLAQIHEQITARRGGVPLNLSSDDITDQIHQMREERDRQLMETCFPNPNPLNP
ncbi:hypothetical protein ACKFKG_26055 [Phormidesmis sp. 146-35]